MLRDEIKVIRVSNAVAAGVTAVNGTGVDLAQDGGYDGVLFVAQFGTLTLNQVTSLKTQQSDDDGAVDAYSDLVGTALPAMADADDNKCLVLDVIRPEKRYVRPVVTRGTANAVIDSVIAILYRARKEPTVDDVSVAFSEGHVSPIEGTA